MNHGPLIFLGTFFALVTSWCGYVLLPQLQIGGQMPEPQDALVKMDSRTNWLARQKGLPIKSAGSAPVYPLARSGVAAQGAEVFRANGCYYCHSQQVRQNGTTFAVLLVKGATNETELVAALRSVRPELSEAEARKLATTAPQAVLENVPHARAEAVVKALSVGGAQAALQIIPFGPDIALGFGRRGNVAQDYLLDHPVMLGAQRVGPDLANIGARQPDLNWHLLHLYNPRIVVAGSTMPPYRHLFEKRKVKGEQSADALNLPKEFAPSAGFEIVPTAEARALAEYLATLRSDAPLFEAPLSVSPQATDAGAQTNAAPASAEATTNAPATNAPTQ